MNITPTLLDKAAESGVIAPDQAKALWAFLSQHQADTPSFHLTHILYYLGGLIAIGAMSLFMTQGWERFGGWGVFFIALCYAAFGLWLMERPLRPPKLAIPAGIVATFVLALTPLAVYGLQAALGFWDNGRLYHQYHQTVDFRWLVMEVATLAAGVVMLWRYRFPYLVMPIALTLWYMSIDITPALTSNTDGLWELRRLVSMYFGLGIILLAVVVDMRSRGEKDYPFWLYLFGVTAFWVELSLAQSDSEWDKLLYLAINLLMIVTAAVLSRRVFAIFGGLGTALYLGHLAFNVFKDSLFLPFALTAIGFLVIYLGVIWQRREAVISARLQSLLPTSLKEMLERRQGL